MSTKNKKVGSRPHKVNIRKEAACIDAGTAVCTAGCAGHDECGNVYKAAGLAGQLHENGKACGGIGIKGGYAAAAGIDIKVGYAAAAASIGIKVGYAAAAAGNDIKAGYAAAAGIGIKVGYAAAAAAGISGDAAVSCRLPGGSRALILSDGMGKGIKAAAGSRLVVNRLRKNLKRGMPVARAIKEVNRHMIEQAGKMPGKEDFATVDLTIIDRETRKAKFYKMGAATSFIIREGRVRKISGAALPVGIIPALRLTHVSAKLRDGDIIVMVSDGITEADRNDMEAGWLCSYLSEMKAPMSARHEAAEILRQAQMRYGPRERDDLTVAVALIEETVTEDEEKDFEDHNGA